jgi:hypothetical protein
VAKTLEATIDVEPDGELRLELSEALPPGHHHGLLILTNGAPGQKKLGPLLDWRIDGDIWPEGYTMSRRQIYGYEDD